MNMTVKRNAVAYLGIGLVSMVLGACSSDDQAQTTASPAQEGGKNSEYIDRTKQIKATSKGTEVETRLRSLDKEFGIKPNGEVAAPVVGTGLAKKAGTIASGTYSPRVIYNMVIGMNVGDIVEAYTTQYDSWVDPVMVFFKSSAIPNGSKTDRGFATVYALSDDYNGLHPRIYFQATESGNYVVQVFPYVTEKQGRANIFLRRKRNGVWSTLLNGPINVNGTIHRPAPGGYVNADVVSGEADPISWIWNLSSVGLNTEWAGVHNDDASSDTRNSRTANTAVFPNGAGGLDVLLFGGYQAGGTASWTHWSP